MTTDAVVECPFGCGEMDICVLAEVNETERDLCCTTSEEACATEECEAPRLAPLSIFEAIVCDCKISGRAYYQCACGYQERVDTDG